MIDRRTDPDPSLVDGTRPAQIGLPLTDLLARPNGPRDRQLLAGDLVTVLGQIDGHAYVRSEKDGYVGFVAANAIAKSKEATHLVTAPATHAYAEASIKSPDRAALSFGVRLTGLGETPDFIETVHGHVPKVHLAAEAVDALDPVQTARLFLGTPYLWGGNSRAGIDCSGLIQTALLAARIPCPGDSDQQQAHFTTQAIDRRAGDVMFWKGHVALLTSPTHLIHANAFHMAVVEEPIDPAIDRIAKSGGGKVTSHVRPSSSG